jgi:hypothetical protein
MSFFLEHSDFSLIPDPDHPTQWRGVAKTQEGLKSLLALWGAPQEDPGHPLCVFSWSPTQEALDALSTHFPDTTVRPLDEADHPAVWDTQKTQAWLTRPENGTTITLTVPKGTSKTKTEPLYARVDACGNDVILTWREHTLSTKIATEGAHRAAFLWEGHAQLRVPSFLTTFRFSGEDAQRLRDLMCSVFDIIDMKMPSELKKAYFTARNSLPVSAFFFETHPPYLHPLFVRTVRAFFETEAVPTNMPFLTVAQRDHFREIARTYDEETQRAAWSRAYKNRVPDEGMALISPQAAVEKGLTSVFRCKKPMGENVLGWVFSHALKHRNAVFFDEVRCAHVTHKGEKHTLNSVRPKMAEPWSTVYSVWDRAEGLRLWNEGAQKGGAPKSALQNEGVTRWVAGMMACAFPFRCPVSDIAGPFATAALEDPLFLSAVAHVTPQALAPYGYRGQGAFFERLAHSLGEAHPSWQSVYERHLLGALLCPPSRNDTLCAP